MNFSPDKHQFSIRSKLAFVIITIITITLLLAASLFTLSQLHENKLNLIDHLTTLAKITGDNAEAAILFDNSNDADKILSELKNDPHIITAAIYIHKKNLFASYMSKQNFPPVFEPPEIEGYIIESNKIHLLQNIYTDNGLDKIGEIYLQASLSPLYIQLQKNIFITGIIVLFSLLIGYFLSFRLQKTISFPILELSDATKIIKNEKDYSIRIHRNDYQEIETLCDGFNGMLQEIQQRDEHLQQLASYDPLTGLANRKYFSDMLHQAIIRGKRKSHKHAILFIDLDRFKHINDSLGHSIGDELLVQVAKRFDLIIRGDDTVARFGGDEFTVLLQEINDESSATEVAERILEIMNEPFKLNSHNVVVSPSIGIVMYPEHGKTAEQLISNADTAMYKSKHAGGNNFWFFTEHMNKAAQKRLKLEESLRKAIHRDEIILHYQPQLCLKTNEIVGVEALVRWNKNNKKLVPPNNFLPLADETGLIIPIGNIIYKKALNTLKELQKENLYQNKIAINMSAKQFRSIVSIEQMLLFIEQLKIDCNLVEIEITEEALIDYNDELISTMHTLKKQGIHLSIDDFGTGYSSLSYLKLFPFDILKIDMSFIKDMQEDEKNQDIVRAIIDMSHHLGLEVVAEGVETELQKQLLTEMGCDIIQGYYFCKPLDEKHFKQFLLQRATEQKQINKYQA
ncbi:MAG: EAL domain-containing protein [Proteobacteria bacterium]|nr:EAL domain-containing protein [Pseudomonadota bacterium]NOG60960.1 EAL domain-containing protein [Pseudomonadota bacterium]